MKIAVLGSGGWGTALAVYQVPFLPERLGIFPKTQKSLRVLIRKQLCL